MKILATINGGSYVVEADADELARVMGYDRAYIVPSHQNKGSFHVNETVPVTEAFRRLGELTSIRKDLRETAAKLAAVSKRLDTILAADPLKPIAAPDPEP